MEEQSQYLNKKEERQQRREQEDYLRQQGRFVRGLKKYFVAVVILAAVGYGIFLLLQSAMPKGEDFSRSISSMGADHITIGSQLPEYNSNPPTSGPHYGQTARSGFREEEIPDQHMIHNLEHGDIWIAYHPRVSDEAKEALKRFSAAKVIITPRSANDSDIALAAWGRLDSFDLEGGVIPVERIDDFIKRYTNRAPEKVPGASGGV